MELWKWWQSPLRTPTLKTWYDENELGPWFAVFSPCCDCVHVHIHVCTFVCVCVYTLECICSHLCLG